MATKHDRARGFPRAVESHFIESWPGFGTLDSLTRAAVVWLACSTYRRGRYAHRVHEDAVMLHCRTRDAMFSGRFDEINDRLKIFEVVRDYRFGGGRSWTMGYKLTPEARGLMDSIPVQSSAIVDTQGVQMKAPARFAIFSRDIHGNNRKGVGNLPAVVPVNIEGMLRLLGEARKWRWHFKDRHPPPESRILEKRLSEFVSDWEKLCWLSDYFIAPLTLLILRADCLALPKGFMEITYDEHSNGRLYAVAGIMQTAPREVRDVAFAGCWDYDISNAHFSILSQLAHRAGEATPAIDEYLLQKREIRESLSSDIGIPISGVKESLIALIYGAQRRAKQYFSGGRWIEPAILEAAGSEEKALALLRHPVFSGLHEEVNRVRNPVLKSMPVHRGQLVNLFGKGIDVKEPPARKLAHVCQGVEAWVLDVVLHAHGDDLRLLQHDGFVSGVRLDVGALERRVLEETGFTARLEERAL